MRTYTLTAFEKNGEKRLDETFTAETNEEAKEIGKKRLAEKQLLEHTHRCVSPEAKLILFHR
ncbi:YhzD family protein [Oceanobacillus halotolerans]|uniref:YhzD family protein n=1 Tax=Oceanobacillus halotolerans TaxID=2663380 RepID=UPI0013DB1194|nr:YhzD family protein [Oceanobacillus halotolerans]